MSNQLPQQSFSFDPATKIYRFSVPTLTPRELLTRYEDADQEIIDSPFLLDHNETGEVEVLTMGIHETVQALKADKLALSDWNKPSAYLTLVFGLVVPAEDRASMILGGQISEKSCVVLCGSRAYIWDYDITVFGFHGLLYVRPVRK